MFPQLVSHKIHFYIWQANINKCNKQYHIHTRIFIAFNKKQNLTVYKTKFYNYTSLYGTSIFNKYGNFVADLPKNYF